MKNPQLYLKMLARVLEFNRSNPFGFTAEIIDSGDGITVSYCDKTALVRTRGYYYDLHCDLVGVPCYALESCEIGSIIGESRLVRDMFVLLSPVLLIDCNEIQRKYTLNSILSLTGAVKCIEHNEGCQNSDDGEDNYDKITYIFMFKDNISVTCTDTYSSDVSPRVSTSQLIKHILFHYRSTILHSNHGLSLGAFYNKITQMVTNIKVRNSDIADDVKVCNWTIDAIIFGRYTRFNYLSDNTLPPDDIIHIIAQDRKRDIYVAAIFAALPLPIAAEITHEFLLQ